MGFQILPLPSRPFEHLFNKSTAELAQFGAIPYTADHNPGYPCRLRLADAKPGERLILVNYEHLKVASPYRSSHAIFITDGAQTCQPICNDIPTYLSSRPLSVRSFDSFGMMCQAALCEGQNIQPTFEQLLAPQEVEYLHVHTAIRGCYLARVESV
ncbi:DUF1203 domain-containing protein [Marinicella sp. W31]|uniref:DUF1203 domain-containing protein n=1 Tax=Marinicella sp. W31 TaxID=3023713 RepID=UPI003756E5AF